MIIIWHPSFISVCLLGVIATSSSKLEISAKNGIVKKPQKGVHLWIYVLIKGNET